MQQIKYLGLDVHKAMTSAVVLDGSGDLVMRSDVPTREESILAFVESIRGSVHVAFEEGTQAQWLHDLLEPLVAGVTVCRGLPQPKTRNKSDRIDAHELARRLRLGELRPIYHGYSSNLRTLRHLVHAYDAIVSDSTRTMLRLRALFRGVAIPAESRSLYNPKRRDEWIALLPHPGLRLRAGYLYDLLTTQREVRKAARTRMIAEVRGHPAWELIRSHPLVGDIRAAALIAWIGSPYRFRTKRQLWSYAGFAVRTWSSGELELVSGKTVRKRAPMTRGLTRTFNRHLKHVLKSLATDLSCRPGPYGDWYRLRLAHGIRPPMAKLALARKVAAVILMTWKKGESFDPERLMRESH